MQTNTDAVTKETIDYKQRLLVQIEDLRKKVQRVDVENGGLQTLGCLTRTTQELEKLNQSVALATFIDTIDHVIPAYRQFSQTLEEGTRAIADWPKKR